MVFSLGTGKLNQYGAEFGRQAYVGLQNRFGTLTLGHQYDFGFEEFTKNCLGPEACVTGYGGSIGNIDGLFGLRLDNAVKYTSTNMNGLQFGAMYSFGNVAGSLHRDSAYSGGLSYTHASFLISGFYTRLNNPTGPNGLDPYAQLGVSSFLGQSVATKTGNGTVTDPFSSAAFAVDSTTIYGLGGTYSIGKLTAALDVVNTEIKGFGNTAIVRKYEAGGSYAFAPDTDAVFGYSYSKLNSVHWNQFSLGANYSLSKRTLLYAGADVQRAHDADAVIGYSFEPASGTKQLDVRFAILHKF